MTANSRSEKIIARIRAAVPNATVREIVNVVWGEWSNQSEHDEWVRIAPLKEIVPWAVVIVRDVVAERPDA